MSRPNASVIVPFAGSDADLETLLGSLAALRLAPGDEVIVADNRPGARAARRSGVEIIEASRVRTPAFARNRAARIANGEWLVFIDADTAPDPSLIDELFVPEPAADTAVLAGWIDDVADCPSLTARHGTSRGRMSQLRTLEGAARPYAQTANCAIRRTAFEQAGGFVDGARAGEDADLCFRLQDVGWRIEERISARVEHRSRATPDELVRQLIRHGSGAAWLERRYPGSFPGPSAAEIARRIAHSGREAIEAAGRGDREAAGYAVLDLLGTCAFELGRRLPNSPRS